MGLRSVATSCEIPGSASNSARIPIIGLPEPYSATKAVGISATLDLMLKPSSDNVFLKEQNFFLLGIPTLPNSKLI